MIQVLIADDHTIVREGLKQILSETPDIVVAGEAGSGKEAISRILKEDFDLILLDITLPDMSGLDVLKQIRAVKPDLRVLILSMHPEEQYGIRVLKAGASGYLTKDRAPDELIRAIRRISLGHKYVSSSLADRLVWEVSTGALQGEESDGLPHGKLSDREFQVLCLIGSGRTATKIAEELSLSVKTISTYRARLLQKLDMKTNAELTRYAIQNRLVE